MVRLYVGGLPEDIQQNEVSLRFAPFGQVKAVELAAPKELHLPGGETLKVPRGFCHVELDPKDGNSVARCISSVSFIVRNAVFVAASHDA
jgi:hypothetical protein